MTETNKTTETSKVDLTDADLDNARGGYTAADGAHKGGTPERVGGTGRIGSVVDHKSDDFTIMKGGTDLKKR